MLRAASRDRQRRVLPAHLESNFINPEFRGAQPLACLRVPADSRRGQRASSYATGPSGGISRRATFSTSSKRRRADIGIVTLAPETRRRSRPHAHARRQRRSRLARALRPRRSSRRRRRSPPARGRRRICSIACGPMTHRDPGLVGAVLAERRRRGRAHLRRPSRAPGRHARSRSRRRARRASWRSPTAPPDPACRRARKRNLGGQPITVSDVARLDDGTMAGSVLTMDRVFACLVTQCGFDLVQAAEMCATTPARELGLVGHGVIASGADRRPDGPRFAPAGGADVDWRGARIWPGNPGLEQIRGLAPDPDRATSRPSRNPVTCRYPSC